MPDEPLAPSSSTPDTGGSFESTPDPALKPKRPPILHRLVVDLPERNGAGFTVNVSEDDQHNGLDKQETVRLVRIGSDGLTPDVRIISRAKYEELYAKVKDRADKRNEPLVPKAPALLNQSEVHWPGGMARVRFYDGRSGKYLVDVEAKDGTRITKLVDAKTLNSVARPSSRLQEAEKAVKELNEALLISPPIEKTAEVTSAPSTPDRQTKKKNAPEANTDAKKASNPVKAVLPVTIGSDSSSIPGTQETQEPPKPEKKDSSAHTADIDTEDQAPSAVTAPPSPTIRETRASLQQQAASGEDTLLHSYRPNLHPDINQRGDQLEHLTRVELNTHLVAVYKEYQALVKERAQVSLANQRERFIGQSLETIENPFDLLTPEEKQVAEKQAFTILRAAYPDELLSTLQIATNSELMTERERDLAQSVQEIRGQLASTQTPPGKAQPSISTATVSADTTASTLSPSATRIKEARDILKNLARQKLAIEPQLDQLDAAKAEINRQIDQLLQQSSQLPPEQRSTIDAQTQVLRKKNQDIAAQRAPLFETYGKTYRLQMNLGAAIEALAEDDQDEDEDEETDVALTETGLQKIMDEVRPVLDPTLFQPPLSTQNPLSPAKQTARSTPPPSTKIPAARQPSGLMEKIRRTAIKPLILAASLGAQNAPPASSQDARTQSLQTDTRTASNRGTVVSGSPFFHETSGDDAAAEEEQVSNQPLRQQAELMRQKTLAMRQTQAQFSGSEEDIPVEYGSFAEEGSDEGSGSATVDQNGDESEDGFDENERADEFNEEKQRERQRNRLKEQVEERIKEKIKDKVKDTVKNKLKDTFAKQGAQAAARSGATAAAGTTTGAAAAGEGAAVAGGPIAWLVILIAGFFWLNIRLILPSEDSSWRKPLGRWGSVGVVCMDLICGFSFIVSTAFLITTIFIITGGPFIVAGGYLGHTIGSMIGNAIGHVLP